MKNKTARHLALMAVILLSGAAFAPCHAQTKGEDSAKPLYNSTGSSKSAPVFIGEGDMSGKSRKSTTGLTGLLDRKPFKMQTKSVAIQEMNNVEAARRTKAEQEAKNEVNRQIRAKRQAEIRAQYAAVAAQNEELKKAKEPLRADDITSGGKTGKPEEKTSGIPVPGGAAPVAQEKTDPYAGKTVVLKTRPAEPGEKKPTRLFNVRER